MEHLWKELIDCGIKSVGTPENEKAEELLFQEFKKISPDCFSLFQSVGDLNSRLKAGDPTNPHG